MKSSIKQQLIDRVRHALNTAGHSSNAVDQSVQDAILAMADLATLLLTTVDTLHEEVEMLKLALGGIKSDTDAIRDDTSWLREHQANDDEKEVS